MVLTDKQRSDLHAGIYDYLVSRGPEFAQCAEALTQADPVSCSANNGKRASTSTSSAPILEKKWTAVPRLQRRVLELERQMATNAKIHAHRSGNDGSGSANPGGGMPGGERRMLPRPPAGHTLQSHSAVVTTVALHPVYTMAASGSEDGTIKLWDHESGEYLRTLKGHTNVVTCVDFSPKGGYLASTSTDLSIKIWDIQEYKCVRTLRGHDHTISAVRFVPPSIGALYLEKGENKAPGAEAAAGGSGSGVDPSVAGSKFLVTASRDQTVKFWDVETGFCDHTVSDHGDWVRCIAVRPANAAAAGGSKDGEAAGGGANSAASKALVATSGNDRTIYVYNAHDKREKLCELRGHDHVVESLSFLCSSLLPKKGGGPAKSAAGGSSWDYLASGSRDRTVRLWSVASVGSCLMTFRAHENWVRGVLVHPSGNHVLSCGDDRSIRVFDIKANRCLRTIEDAHPHFVTAIAMHHTLPIMVSGGVDHTVKCWQLD
mmetsp:Transcript_16187/g.29222  ORF Transcript_16187/g.29222 Transcript_16187/m.29222 type:complete len:488 (+) Transcript_16187:135-1598(+)|eukprot:CAMPEP_0196132342 /NCGR_PEP_ID=MMETSP0910-20130528/2007_1 /TAXON_ID=49265 /ORGANISM="Thalassiosira rotula, Strain GSO102" /LENGTH=487 /DNA_ID=CAMNT_0041391945 /DNA_START=113 /DNA_END=1576 /DNA_ORIENTATION=-